MKYTESHEWVQVDGDVATIGITEFAQGELGDVVFIELPSTGKVVKAGQDAAVLESTKAAADVYSPLSGEIVEINGRLSDEPELINQSPLQEGWIFKVRLDNASEMDALMDETAYQQMTS